METQTNTSVSDKNIKMDLKESKYATGRRKKSIAKVWLKKGNGSIFINGKKMIDYFKTYSISSTSKEMRFVDAISDAIHKKMQNDSSVVMMGQDIAEYGGVFKISEGFLDEFGPERIKNTPIIESGIIGAAMGMALRGYKPIVEMQFAY